MHLCTSANNRCRLAAAATLRDRTTSSHGSRPRPAARWRARHIFGGAAAQPPPNHRRHNDRLTRRPLLRPSPRVGHVAAYERARTAASGPHARLAHLQRLAVQRQRLLVPPLPVANARNG
eukprot:scaffold6401_cov255-Prasinococcus_capsulatus_cf.AAC.1